MSKAFTKESDGGIVDMLRVDDAALPPGEKNYMTPAGAAWLRAEIERLREAPRGEPRQRLTIEARLATLLRRLEALEIIDPATQPGDRVVFGATVTVRGQDGRERRYRIVGVDEVDPTHGLVSWRTPVARALLGRGVGEVVLLRTPGGEEELEVVRIERD